MFDIGWSEMLVIGAVALIAIGPKELPGVLRMVGQWVGKAKRMAADFQGQFQEAMREVEVADLQKQFDEVKETASGISSGNLLSSRVTSIEEGLKADTSSIGTPTPPETPTAETFREATIHEAITAPDPAASGTARGGAEMNEPAPAAKAS